MMTTTLETQTLGDLALTRPAAVRVFHRHGIDFCCGGKRTLGEAVSAQGLELQAILDEIGREEKTGDDTRWDEAPIPELIQHILAVYHEGHRRDLPPLLQMARKVEEVHGEKASFPNGLREHLEHIQVALESHLQKEEQILFPAILAGQGAMAMGPISVMEAEHVEHGVNLAKTRELAHNLVPPEEACTTWRALYNGLEELEREIMTHIHLENNLLFPKVLQG